MLINWTKRTVGLLAALICCTALHAQQQFYISDIQVVGNKTTKEKIILRELDVKKGDSVLVSRMKQVITHSMENLNNLPLFNYVEIDYEFLPNSNDHIVLRVRVEERWYYFPLINVKLEDRNTSTWIKDFDMTRITFEFGAQIYNLLGLNHTLTSGVQMGYQQAWSFHYKNITLDRAQKHFISTGISLQMSHNMDVMTVDDAPLRMKTPNQILKQNISWYLNYTYRHDVRTTHNLYIGLEHKKMADTILLINPDYWGNDQRERLNATLQYFFRTDQRDYTPYPLKGYYLKIGGNLFVTNDLSVRYLQLNTNAQYYWDLGKRWYAAGRITAGISIKNTKAYILDQALGYGENVLRGYEYHVVDGQHFAALNSTLRYNIVPKKVFVINWLSKLSKFNKIHFAFYANAFWDMGVTSHQYLAPFNYLSNQFLYSGGLGIDLVTYYDIILTLNYSINKQNDRGFYFSFKLPFM